MSYLTLKSIHVGLASLSVGWFCLRFLWSRRNSPLAAHPLNRVLPHVLDTLFLASGIALAFCLRIQPLMHAWLSAKLIGLLLYIILAWLALRSVRRPFASLGLLVAALATFAWIVSVALSKSAYGYLGHWLN